MGVLDFPKAGSLDFPQDYPSVSDGDECALVSPPQTRNARTCVLPGRDHDQVVSTLAALEEQLGNGPLVAGVVARNAANKSVAYVENLIQIRLDYMKQIETAEVMYLENKQVMSKELASRLTAMRDTTRGQMRRLSNVPGKVYQWMDNGRDVKALARKQLIEVGNFEEALKSLGKPRPGMGPEFIRPARHVTKLLRRAGTLGTIIIAVDLGADALRYWKAHTDEEKQVALKSATRSVGTIALSSGATVVAGAICIGLGVASGGLGFIACGVAAGVAGGIYGGDVAEAIVARLRADEAVAR